MRFGASVGILLRPVTDSTTASSDAPHEGGAAGAASEAHETGGAAALDEPGVAAESGDAADDDGEADADGEGQAGSDGEGDAPRRKRKRRRRRKRKPQDGASAPMATAAASGPASAGVADPMAAMANLAAGLFSHIDDREIPCRVDGCRRTWTWTAAEQIQKFGQPPPRRMCSEHAAAHESITDLAVPCANPGCDKTWTWTRSARLSQRGGPDRPPSRICDDCQAEEKSLSDREAPCKIEGCKRTWLWTRDAQLKHRTWLRRSGEEGEPEGKGRGRGRRRKQRRASVHEPPPRMCEPCRARLAKLTEREGPCKVHGCTRQAKIDRDTQLRAWAAMGTEDIDAEPSSLPRRMCDVCREFCKNHPDREVPCGRPGCDKTWTFKTGAQLQAFLAGRLEDPMRLCDECGKGDFMQLERPAGAPAGAEVMPCVVLGCDGVWYWLPGTQLAPANPGDEPPDRMCAEHRARIGATAKVVTKPTENASPQPAEVAPEPSDEAAPGFS